MKFPQVGVTRLGLPRVLANALVLVFFEHCIFPVWGNSLSQQRRWLRCVLLGTWAQLSARKISIFQGFSPIKRNFIIHIFILYILIFYFVFCGYVINFQNMKSVADRWKNSSHTLGFQKLWVPTAQKTRSSWYSASDELLPHRKQRIFREWWSSLVILFWGAKCQNFEIEKFTIFQGSHLQKDSFLHLACLATMRRF